MKKFSGSLLAVPALSLGLASLYAQQKNAKASILCALLWAGVSAVWTVLAVRDVRALKSAEEDGAAPWEED